MLVLLNGPPASGKSTIAARLVERRPLALNLDIESTLTEVEAMIAGAAPGRA